MNKKSALGIGTLMSVLACSVAFAFGNNKVEAARAYSPDDSYSATGDHFVASFHRNNALRNAYNGDDNEGDSSRLENVTISDLDHTSNISWKVSIAKYSYDSFRNLKMGNKGTTIENSSDPEFAAIYNATGVGTGHYVSAMYSTTKISNIQDLFVSWGYQAGQLHESAFGDIYLLGKVSDTWTLIKSYNAGYGSNDRGADMKSWDSIIANINHEKMFNAGVLGEDAQIAIAYDSGSDASKNSYICLHTLMVNRVASAKATMHYWDKGGNDLELCTYISDTKANNTVRIYMFGKYINQIQVDGGEYNNKTIDGLNAAANFAYGKARESNYYYQLAYLCSAAGFEISLTPTSSARFSNGLAKTADGTILVVASLTVVTLVSAVTLVLNRKKKHN